MKTLIFTIFMLASLLKLEAQTISGKFENEKNAPFEFVTIALLNATDSALLKSSVTDASGNYAFKNLTAGKFLIAASFAGYKKGYSTPFSVAAGQLLQVPDIVLLPASKALKEVTITAKKPFVEKKADKLIVNVEGSAVSVGNTALEVLQKAPGVTVDKDDNISMNGKNSVLVMLDGKPSYMSNADLANMLRSMQSDQIESIELITNPSARYDASGNGGIINIKTKKNKNMGFNGSVTMGSGYGRTGKYNGSTNLNLRKGKLNIFGSYNYSNNGNKSNFELNRKVTASDIITNFDQDNTWDSRRSNNSYKSGVDIFLTKNTTIGFLAKGYFNREKQKAYSGTQIMNEFMQRDSAINVTGINNKRFTNNAFNFNFKTTLDTLGRELSFDADYSDYNGRMNEFRDSYYSNFSNNIPVEYINNLAPAKIEIWAGKLDYTHPFSKTFKLETGWKSSWVTTDNDLRFSTLINSDWVADQTRSNHFIYKENINAAYLTLNKEFKSVTLQMGLRAEHTNSVGNSITIDSVVERNYLELFPSISLSRKIGKNHQLALSYSRRIDRPSYNDLNPFIYILDKYTYEQGNPRLNPQFTKSAQLSYTYKGSTTATLSYSRTTDVMTQITEQNNESKVTYAQERNLDSQTIYSLNIYAPIPVKKWWNINNNIEVFNMGFTADLLGSRLKADQTVFQMNTDHQFTITKTFSAELSARYMSPLQYGIFQIRNSPSVNMGFKKSFNNGKLNTKLNLNDVFNTMRNRGSTTYANMNFNFRNKWESQVVNFSVSYRFGSTNVKPERRRATSLDDEAGRIKN